MIEEVKPNGSAVVYCECCGRNADLYKEVYGHELESPSVALGGTLDEIAENGCPGFIKSMYIENGNYIINAPIHDKVCQFRIRVNFCPECGKELNSKEEICTTE